MKNSSHSRIVALACLLCAAVSVQADVARLKVPLTSTGADADAQARLTAVLNEAQSMVLITGTRFTPNQEYGLYANGVLEARQTANPSGALKFSLRNPATRSIPALRFDPRGSTLEIKQGEVVLFSSIISGPGEPPGSSVNEQAGLQQLSATRKGTATYRLSTRGVRQFTIVAGGLSGTNWGVYVDGVRRGDLILKGRSATARFGSSPSRATEQPLSFDPRGRVIDIRNDSTNAYTGRMECRARDLNFARPSVRTGIIPATEAAGGGTAKGKYRVGPDAEQKFTIKVEDVPAGAYELLVDDVLTATIQVRSCDDDKSGSAPGDENSTEGKVEFVANSDDADKLPLTFDPFAVAYTIRQDATVFFFGPLTNTVASTNAGSLEIKTTLINLGVVPGAAQMKYESEDEDEGEIETSFKVELEGVTAGDYALLVDGVQVGTITAALAHGSVRGKIEFENDSDADDDDDDDELPLNFDPLGKNIVIQFNGVAAFERVLE